MYEDYKLDPAWCHTAPGLALDAALTYTGAKLELLSDIDMLLIVKRGIRAVRGIALIGPKSLYSATPLVFNSPDGGVPLGRSPQNFTWMSADGQFTKWHKILPKISIA